mmetsp:Transcript_26230/g.51329  ORF Transcript_26230/g.51329 Transcript_26230/m.51329 type:complete len:1539 (-) Transcript_26230:166-4782(-)
MGVNASKTGDLEALKTILLLKGKDASEQDVKKIWQYFDENRNGKLEMDEIKKMQRLRVSLFREDAERRCLRDNETMTTINRKADKLIARPEMLWRKLDLNQDGRVQWEEFKTLAHDSVLCSPFEGILEEYHKRLRDAQTGAQTEREQNHSVSIDKWPQSQASELQSEDTTLYAEPFPEISLEYASAQAEAQTDTIVSLKPYGWEGVLEKYPEIKTKVMCIKFSFALCYAHTDNVELHLEKQTPDKPGMQAPLEKKFPWRAENIMQERGLEGNMFYFKVATNTLDDSDIYSLTENEMFILLPWLLNCKELLRPVRKRLLLSRRLMRRGWWLRLSEFEMVHTHARFYLNEFQKTLGMTKAYKFFCEMLAKNCEEDNKFLDWQFFCPIWPEWDVTEVVVKKKFSSGNAPSLLSCKLAHLEAFSSPLMYKPDDIRSDMCVVHSFQVFNKIWAQSRPMYGRWVPNVYTFECCPMTKGVGVMEFIRNAVPLQDWNAKAILNVSTTDKIHFLNTMAGSYVACYILGCRDRHFENFMVKDDTTFLQIDFKRCFDRKASGPVDAPHFSIKVDVKNTLAQLRFDVKELDRQGLPINAEKSGWKIFKELCWHALRGLRAKGIAVVQIITGLFSGLRKKVKYFRDVNAMQKWVHTALSMGDTDEEARQKLFHLIENGVISLTKWLKNKLHTVADNIRITSRAKSKDTPAQIFRDQHGGYGHRGGSITHQRGMSSFLLTDFSKKGPAGHHRPNRTMMNSDFAVKRASNDRMVGSPPSTRRRFKNRHVYDVSCQGWDESHIHSVYSAILSHPNLGKLNLSFNRFGLSGTKMVLSSLNNNTTLRELNLACIYFGPEGLSTIASFVHGNGVLETLNVQQCQVCRDGDYEGLKSLRDAVTSVGCGLRELEIQNNKLKNKGLSLILGMVKKNFIIEDIKYEMNEFMPTHADNRAIQQCLFRNRTEKVMMVTICGVRKLAVGSNQKLKARIHYPGKLAVESHAVICKDGVADWDFTCSFTAKEELIKTSQLQIEVYGSNKRLGCVKIGPSDLQVELQRPPSPASVSPAPSRSPKNIRDRPSSLVVAADSKSSEYKLYRLREGSAATGSLLVSIHAGDLLGGGIISATVYYMPKGKKVKKRFSREKGHEMDATYQLRNNVKNGFLIFEEQSDLKEEIIYSDEREIDLNQALVEAQRIFTYLKIVYRVGSKKVCREFEVPIRKFTRLFVGFGVPGALDDTQDLKEASQEELMSAMTRDSRRRSKFFETKELKKVMEMARDEKKGTPDNPLRRLPRPKPKLSFPIPDTRTQRSASSPPRPNSNLTAKMKKRRKPTMMMQMDKMDQLIKVSDIFHTVCGSRGGRTQLEGRSVKMLLRMAGPMLPKRMCKRIMEQETITTKDFCRWLRKEGVSNQELDAIVTHVNSQGPPSALASPTSPVPKLSLNTLNASDTGSETEQKLKVVAERAAATAHASAVALRTMTKIAALPHEPTNDKMLAKAARDALEKVQEAEAAAQAVVDAAKQQEKKKRGGASKARKADSDESLSPRNRRHIHGLDELSL